MILKMNITKLNKTFRLDNYEFIILSIEYSNSRGFLFPSHFKNKSNDCFIFISSLL